MAALLGAWLLLLPGYREAILAQARLGVGTAVAFAATVATVAVVSR